MRRREFLHAGVLTLPGIGFGRPVNAEKSAHETSCILLMLVGGASQLDTWDMKPDAPSYVHGPFRPIPTNVPGIEISEIFPRMARHADKYALIRSVYHDAPAFHDAGHQLMQTGRLFEETLEHPNFGSVLGKLTGSRSAVLPFAIGNTGGNMPHGQSAGWLGDAFAPRLIGRDAFDLHNEPEALRRQYGLNPFGESCLMARRLVESGTRFVTVNMFETVFDETTWDIHGSAPFSPLSCYRDYVGPMFDGAYSSLLQDLSRRGMLERTLVVAMGEFGRTPKINHSGGRDHWPGCSTVVMAGGGVKGGQVYGSSDRTGAEPRDHPVDAQMIAATVYSALGISPDTQLHAPDGRCFPIVDPGTRRIPV